MIVFLSSAESPGMASCQSIRQFPTRRPSSKGYCSFAYSAFPLAEFSTELRLPHEESSLTRIASKRRTAGGDIVEAKGETYCGIRTAARLWCTRSEVPVGCPGSAVLPHSETRCRYQCPRHRDVPPPNSDPRSGFSASSLVIASGSSRAICPAVGGI